MTSFETTPPPRRLPDVDAEDLARRIATLLASPSPHEALDDGLAEVVRILLADAVALYARDDSLEGYRLLGSRPDWQSPARDLQPARWFPWGLGSTGAGRYVFVADAAPLRAHPEEGATLGTIGVASCLHLPLAARTHHGGAIHAYWAQPPEGWEDGRVDLVRMIGHALLEVTNPAA